MTYTYDLSDVFTTPVKNFSPEQAVPLLRRPDAGALEDRRPPLDLRMQE
jgi:hypothetical protein